MYRLVRILRDMRAFLTEKGATFMFDTKVEGFLTGGGGEEGRRAIRGLRLAGGEELLADRFALRYFVCFVWHLFACMFCSFFLFFLKFYYCLIVCFVCFCFCLLISYVQ